MVLCLGCGQLQVELVVLILEVLVHVGQSLDLFAQLADPEVGVAVGRRLEVEESLLDGGERLHLALEGGVQSRQVRQPLAEGGVLSLQTTVFLKKKLNKILTNFQRLVIS